MEDLSQPTIETMMAGAVVIVLKAQVMYMVVMEVGGGLATALIVCSPALTPIFTGSYRYRSITHVEMKVRPKQYTT